ncbi:MAG: glycosyltransferase family 9 protein [Candidatus Eiseniibacteriota bacterium]
MRRLEAPPGGFRHIAVIRLSSLGDVVLTLPTVRALKSAYPRAALDYWTKLEYADVVRHDPAITHVRELDPDARRIEDLVSMSAELEDCDLIVDLHSNLRSRVLSFQPRIPVLRAPGYRLRRSLHVHARWLRPRPVPAAVARFGAALTPLGLSAEGVPVLYSDAASERWADQWLAARGWDKPVALAPGARHATKRWPEAHWCALAARLTAAGLPVMAFSLEREREQLPELAAQLERSAGAWCCEPLSRMAALLSRCRAAVSCDSGLMHVAAARGVPVVALFGSTAPELGFAPAGVGHTVLCRHEPCQPCTLHGRERCPRRHFRCMTELRDGEVWAALSRRLG